MMMKGQFPPALLVRATVLLLRGLVRFPKDEVGKVVHDADEDFVVFRKVVLEPSNDLPEIPKAIFEVRFQFARFSEGANRKLSLIPIPLIVAQPGFRSKTWLTGRQTGTFKGIYEWDTVACAEEYWHSFPMALMKRRAAEGSLSRKVWEA
ncbi:hypothetical protein ACFL6R_04805 [Gemmatimonadota bacterium]